MALSISSAALGDITADVLPPSVRITNRADQQTAVLDFDYLGTSLLVPEDTITVSDGATVVFRGLIRNRKRGILHTQPSLTKVQRITCQDLTPLLADDVVDGTLVLSSGQSDQAMIDTIVGYSTKGLDSSHTYNQVVTASMPSAVDVSNMTLYEAVVAVCKVGGGTFYVDDQYHVHHFTTQSNPAPFDLVDSSVNGTTRVGYADLVLPDETFDLVNAVWCVGGSGTTPTWRPVVGSWPTTSHTLYGRRERVLRLPKVHDQTELEAAGDSVLAVQEYPSAPVTLTCYHPGLKAGMVANLESTPWSLSQSYPVAEVITTVQAGTTDQLQYAVTLGSSPDNLGTMLADTERNVADAFAVIADIPTYVPDTTPPAVPANLVLSTGTNQTEDGVANPYIAAEWDPVADSDLEAYELELDRAISGDVSFTASASGTGGSLAPGTYYVRVTGQGQVAGESYTQDVQEVEVASGQRLYVNITAKSGITTYNLYASTDPDPLGSPTPATTTTTGSNVEITAAGAGSTAPTSSTAVSFISPKAFRTGGTTIATEDVAGGVYYAGRVRAVDTSGNRSAFGTVSGVTVAPDNTAPSIPSGLTASGGFRLAGLRWSRNTEPDLAGYEVRYAPDDTGSPGQPDTTAWVVLATNTTILVVSDLEPDTLFYFQVRAIDLSGNVQTDAGDPTAVSADANPEAGWSNVSPDWVTATPTLVGAADVAFNSVITSILAANAITADDITTGTLRIGGLGGTPDFLLVYDISGNEIGRWDQYGLLVKDPANTDRQVRLLNGVLEFTSDGGSAWTTAVGPEGIQADSITLGTAPGGHNAVPNAGFELANFTTPLSKTWTVTTDWDDGLSQVYVNVSGSSLTLTSAAY
jgi:hypothetical protein